MSLELQVLGWCAVLWVVQLLALSLSANRQLDPRVLMGPRDSGVSLTGAAGRLQRAFQNLTEGLVPFTVAVVLVELGGTSSPLTQGAALTFLAARILYVPAYLRGWAPGRSVIWGVGFLALIALLGAGLFGIGAGGPA